MTVLEQLAAWASTLCLGDVPGRVVDCAKSQVVSLLAAARAGLSHPAGQAVVRAFGSPLQDDPRQSACVLAGLTPWLHYDDTAYAGHLSNSTVTVPVAYARPLGLDGRSLLTAVITANECAARITAAATLGPFRGQSAAHAHLAGSVSGRLRAERAPARVWVDAMGLAFAAPPWPLVRGFLGSDAKLLTALAPVRLGLDACDAARAGMAGAADIFEHEDGFLARFATVPMPEAIAAGLGERWHTDTLSFKVHPGGPGGDAAVDCAKLLHADLAPVEADDIAEVVIETSIYTLLLDQRAAAYLQGPRSPVSASVLSTAYTVATALLTGELVPADFAAPCLDEERRWDLAGKVRLEHDEAMTRDSMACEVPFGEALRQAGPRAAAWLEHAGGRWLVDLVGEIPPPSEDLTEARKVTPARVTVRLVDGRRATREVYIPEGAVGSPSRRDHRRLVRDKFLATGGSARVADGILQLERIGPTEVARLLEAALTGG